MGMMRKRIRETTPETPRSQPKREMDETSKSNNEEMDEKKNERSGVNR